jgi:hypothetical protein
LRKFSMWVVMLTLVLLAAVPAVAANGPDPCSDIANGGTGNSNGNGNGTGNDGSGNTNNNGNGNGNGGAGARTDITNSCNANLTIPQYNQALGDVNFGEQEATSGDITSTPAVSLSGDGSDQCAALLQPNATGNTQDALGTLPINSSGGEVGFTGDQTSTMSPEQTMNCAQN